MKLFEHKNSKSCWTLELKLSNWFSGRSLHTQNWRNAMKEAIETRSVGPANRSLVGKYVSLIATLIFINLRAPKFAECTRPAIRISMRSISNLQISFEWEIYRCPFTSSRSFWSGPLVRPMQFAAKALRCSCWPATREPFNTCCLTDTTAANQSRLAARIVRCSQHVHNMPNSENK